MKKSNVLASIVVLGFVALLVVGCNKYDKMSILGTYTIDLKEAQGLGAVADSAKEELMFHSGGTYSQIVKKRINKKPENWKIEGKIERKNNKITFLDRIQDEITPMAPVTYEYRIKDGKLVLIVEGEGFQNNEKIYTKQTKQ